MTTRAESRVPGRIAISADQRRRFDEDGFFVVGNALSEAEIVRLTEAVDGFAAAVRRRRDLPAEAPVRVRHIVARHPAFRDLLDHPTILPLLVDVLGPNIQLRGSNLDVRPAESAPDFAHEWHRDEPAGGWPTVDGAVPFLDVKVGWYLTDLRDPASGTLRVIPGSHRAPAHAAAGRQPVEITVAPGSALVWRTALLHQIGPNLGGRTRKCLYLAYQHRWMRPSDYLTASAGLLAKLNPIQRQLLGAVADPDSYIKDPDVEPCSTFWTPSRADLPLREWAEARGYDVRGKA